jgi:hypothetical protein
VGFFKQNYKIGVFEMRYLIDRFKEPSSWAGFAMIATTFFHVPSTTVEVVSKAVAAVLAAVAVLVPEKK